MEIKVSFPHMGNSYIAFRGLVAALGCTPVIPDRPNSKTVKEGSKVSPEAICFPFKINMGDFLNAFEKGTQVLVMVTGVGPCRFGYYGELFHYLVRGWSLLLEMGKLLLDFQGLCQSFFYPVLFHSQSFSYLQIGLDKRMSVGFYVRTEYSRRVQSP
ncbi:hypothetical protein HKBW3S09_01067 [Candidatus Hakubella thermalkaliphila]|uniref:DUF2229 domain-containing protein n=1 Tax=Candidatus Hakubella thermalkaliphila TaxID=2754717 RepID=A0A6V8NTG1_9ACTN|nr:hypothetical protein HKBW3S09_01067 [Candidatus Hakubella thermalkaliphila]